MNKSTTPGDAKAIAMTRVIETVEDKDLRDHLLRSLLESKHHAGDEAIHVDPETEEAAPSAIAAMVNKISDVRESWRAIPKMRRFAIAAVILLGVGLIMFGIASLFASAGKTFGSLQDVGTSALVIIAVSALVVLRMKRRR